MQVLHRSLTPIDKSMIGRVPEASEMGDVIDEDATIYIDGKLAMIYMILPEDQVAGMREVAESAKMSPTNRVNGIPTKAAVFGAMPGSPSRTVCYCRYSRPTHEQQHMLPAIQEFDRFVTAMYKAAFPERFAEDMEWLTTKVHPDWRWLPGPYQTVNFNNNFAIPYHRDRGNVSGSLSNVLILSKHIRGGELVLPELGVSLSQRDRAWVLFNGEGLVHGVRPIEYLGGSLSYRSSIVYYTLRAMASCGSKTEELTKTQALMTAKARRPQEERLAKVRHINRKLLTKITT